MLYSRLLCPYDIPDVQWVDDVSKWPPVEFGHLYVYFVETPGGYTLEAIKAYKSLEAYNYYRLVPSFYSRTSYKLMLLTQSLVAGYVQCIFMILVIASTVLKSLVNCSQRINDQPHQPWVAVMKSGTIVTAHCSCMAGYKL